MTPDDLPAAILKGDDITHQSKSCEPQLERAAFYVDGLNLYHALDDMGQPYLKWLNLALLARLLVVGKREMVTQIVYCTAITNDPQKQIRHRAYVKALEGAGVVVIQGHFSQEERTCRNCHETWKHPTEKEGDISLAIAVINDAHLDLFDVAYLITTDGDQAPVARMLKSGFPKKRLITVAPPNRSHNFSILAEAHGKSSMTPDLAEKCLFERGVLDKNGNMVIRPNAYDPPIGWVAPRLRPQKTKSS